MYAKVRVRRYKMKAKTPGGYRPKEQLITSAAIMKHYGSTSHIQVCISGPRPFLGRITTRLAPARVDIPVEALH